jgi:hypothetical protein
MTQIFLSYARDSGLLLPDRARGFITANQNLRELRAGARP